MDIVETLEGVPLKVEVVNFDSIRDNTVKVVVAAVAAAVATTIATRLTEKSMDRLIAKREAAKAEEAKNKKKTDD